MNELTHARPSSLAINFICFQRLLTRSNLSSSHVNILERVRERKIEFSMADLAAGHATNLTWIDRITLLIWQIWMFCVLCVLWLWNIMQRCNLKSEHVYNICMAAVAGCLFFKTNEQLDSNPCWVLLLSCFSSLRKSLRSPRHFLSPCEAHVDQWMASGGSHRSLDVRWDMKIHKFSPIIQLNIYTGWKETRISSNVFYEIIMDIFMMENHFLLITAPLSLLPFVLHSDSVITYNPSRYEWKLWASSICSVQRQEKCLKNIYE